jgi:hypothetical protein
MLNFKRFILITVTCTTLSFTGCVKTIESHHTFTYPWLQEQVEKGLLTEKEALEIEQQMIILNSK